MPQNTLKSGTDNTTHKNSKEVYHTGKPTQLDSKEFNSWIRLFVVGILSLLFMVLLFVFLKNF